MKYFKKLSESQAGTGAAVGAAGMAGYSGHKVYKNRAVANKTFKELGEQFAMSAGRIKKLKILSQVGAIAGSAIVGAGVGAGLGSFIKKEKK